MPKSLSHVVVFTDDLDAILRFLTDVAKVPTVSPYDVKAEDLHALFGWPIANGASPLPDPSTWGDELVGTSGDGKPILAQIGREVVTFDPSQPSMELLNPNHAYGTVEDCIGYVQRLVDAGADEILFLNQMGTVPQWAMLDTIRNIGEHVIPHFRT